MSDYSHLIGYRFPGGMVKLPSYMAWLWADATLAKPDPGVAHPSLGYVVAMDGMGISIQDIFDLLDAEPDSGVMFGEISLEFEAPLRVGGTYRVEGGIVEVERKSGRRAGVFDRLVFALRVLDPESGALVVANHNTWIFPRGGA